MKVLVTGAKGQLASAIDELLTAYNHTLAREQRKCSFDFFSRKELDITDAAAVNQIITDEYDYIINTAAYTNVDGAESEKELAEAVNHVGVRNLSRVASKNNIQLIHISTDYVFSGETFKPYAEDDEPNPSTYYGETKLRGEQAVINETNNGIILRTSWLFHFEGSNFVRKILSLAKKKHEIKATSPLKIVCDQIGAPTSAESLGRFIISHILDQKFTNTSPQIYNFTNTGVASWFDLACAAIDTYNVSQVKHTQNITCNIVPIPTTEYPTPAKRPPFSVLNLQKIRKEFGVIPKHWMDALYGVTWML